jgi:Protein of unknown function (DUF2393)
MNAKQSNDPGILSTPGSPGNSSEERSWLPWVIAGLLIAAGLAALVFFTGRHEAKLQDGGATLAAADPYAVNLPITGLQMSEASNFAGGKVTYMDGQIANNGPKTITGVIVQVVFRNELGELSQKEVMPINLIRTREPYVDTQAVSASPIRSGDQREFRLIFDHVTMDWNQQYPEVRIIDVKGK